MPGTQGSCRLYIAQNHMVPMFTLITCFVDLVVSSQQLALLHQLVSSTRKHRVENDPEAQLQDRCQIIVLKNTWELEERFYKS